MRDKSNKAPEPSLFSFDAGTSVPGQETLEQGSPLVGGGSKRSRKSKDKGKDAQHKAEAGDTEAAVFFTAGQTPGEKDALGPQYGYERKLFRSKNEVSVYAQQMDERYAMDKRSRTILILCVVVVILIPLLVVLPSGWLTAEGLRNGFAGWVEILQKNLVAVGNKVSGVEDGNGIHIVFWQTLAVAVIGAALALNGAVYQGALKNALASPSTLGVMSGGTLGTLIYTLTVVTSNSQELAESGFTAVQASETIAVLDAMNLGEYILYTQQRAFFSIIGCFVIVLLALAIAYIAGRGKVSKSALVIAGQVFAAVIAGIVSVVRTYITYYGTDEQLLALQSTVNGSVANIMGPIQFCLVAVPLLIGFIVVMALRGRLNLLAFNDDEARSMGISVGKTRIAVIAVCTIMTAVVVSFCGQVGFVGFLVPHIARKVVGPDLRYLIPASALVGAIYLLLSNYIMSLGALLNGSLGTFTSLLGIFFFIVAIVLQRRRGNADWI